MLHNYHLLPLLEINELKIVIMEVLYGLVCFVVSLFVIIYILSVIPGRIRSIQRQNAQILKMLERDLEQRNLVQKTEV
jgi:hypothetical protein